ncbi:hypothetical protein MTO96_030460 [Rhipicephalus appendiculatus]
MVRLVFYPLFNNEEDLFSPLKALDQLSDSVISAVRQADKKTKQASLDRSPSCVCLRGASPLSCRRKRHFSEEVSSRSADSTSDDESKFVVNCNVRGYKPEEISVRAIDDCVEVSAKHEEQSEDGCSYVKREFTRRFTLPEGVKAETVTCALCRRPACWPSKAPKPEVPSKKPRMIPITVESSKPIEAASDESNKEAEKQKEGAAPAS